MSTIYFDPIVDGENNSPNTVNSRLGDLDSAIVVVTSEVVAARNGGSNLNTRIGAEALARVAADGVLSDRIDNLIADAGTSDAEVLAARTSIPYAAGTPPATLSAALGYTAAGVANVKAYGAVGNGVANDSVAVQAAVTNNALVYFPPGTYLLSEVLVPSGRTIYGDGGATLTNSTGYVMRLQGSNITVRDLNFAGVVGTESCLYFDLAAAHLDDLRISHCRFVGLGSPVVIRSVGVAGRRLTNVHIEDNHFEDISVRILNLTLTAGLGIDIDNFFFDRNMCVDIAPESSGGPFGGAIYIGEQTSITNFFIRDNVAYRAAPQFLAMSETLLPRVNFVITGNLIHQEGTTHVVHMSFQFENVDNLVFANNSCWHVSFEHLNMRNCRNFRVSDSHFEDCNIGVSITDTVLGQRSYGVVTNCTFEDCECADAENSGHKGVYVFSDGAEVAISNCRFARNDGSKNQYGIEVRYQNTAAGANAKWSRNFNSVQYMWTLDASGRYYVRRTGSLNPNIGKPINVYENGTALTLTGGAISAMTAGQWGWGDNNGLGYNTVYVRLSDSTTPTNNEVTAGYPRVGISVVNCQFDGLRVGLTVLSGGSYSYPDHASVVGCTFVACQEAVRFSIPSGSAIFGCAFRDCGTDVAVSSDVVGLRCMYNLHVNTNTLNAAAGGAYVINIGANYSLWEISGCTFRGVNNVHVLQSGSFSPRKRMLIFRDNDSDSSNTGLPASNGGVITMITNSMNVFMQQSAIPSGGSDWTFGDMILSTATSLGGFIGWILRGAGSTNASVVTAQAGYRTGTGTPTFNAQMVGEEYLNTSTSKWYKAVSVGSGVGDWAALN